MTFLQAVAMEEGYYVDGSRSQRNNNPGDIEWGRFASGHGATRPETLPNGGAGRFAYFPDATTGFSAMRALFQAPSYKGLTVEAALNRWAPPVENQTNIYIKNVCDWVGCLPSHIIDDLVTL